LSAAALEASIADLPSVAWPNHTPDADARSIRSQKQQRDTSATRCPVCLEAMPDVAGI